MTKASIKENKKIDYLQLIIDFVYIIIGTYLMSFAIKVLLVPLKLSTGGASGIATIFYYLYQIPLGVTVIIINIPLFIIALFKLGIKFSVKSIITTTLLSVFLDIFSYTDFVKMLNLDIFLASVYGGLLMGLSLSLLFKAGASSGGSDLLAQIIYRLTSIQSLSQILLAIDAIIITSIVIVFKNANLGLYSILAIFISKKVIDVVFEGIYYTKIINIITKSDKDIVNGVLNELKRGATVTKVKGAYTNDEYNSITVIITLPEVSKLKQIVRKYDNNALVYVLNANEVLGHGFKQM
jgi:uncharacterized membrane-anchored protein YitT (DUF2179 family)